MIHFRSKWGFISKKTTKELSWGTSLNCLSEHCIISDTSQGKNFQITRLHSWPQCILTLELNPLLFNIHTNVFHSWEWSTTHPTSAQDSEAQLDFISLPIITGLELPFFTLRFHYSISIGWDWVMAQWREIRSLITEPTYLPALVTKWVQGHTELHRETLCQNNNNNNKSQSRPQWWNQDISQKTSAGQGISPWLNTGQVHSLTQRFTLTETNPVITRRFF